MNKFNGNKIINLFATLLAGVLTIVSVICTFSRTKDVNGDLSIQILASSLALPQGAVYISATKPTEKETDENTFEASTTQTTSATIPNNTKNTITDDESQYSGDKFPVIEQQFGSSGDEYGNFSVKNSTDYNIDYKNLLSSKLGFQITDTENAQVLIVHTHTTESYLINDNGYYFTDYPFRTEDSQRNMIAVGEKIVNSLKKNGIGAIHATEIHDRTYTGSYSRSEETIYKYLEEYPDIKVILDIHRDAVGYDDERGKYKPTFTYNGKKAAQIMIMSGYDPNNSYGLGHWKENLTFALKLQQKAESLYPGMTRPLYFGDFAYNMFINNGSLLIEVGTETNTLSEAEYTGELLGNVIAQVLKDELK